MQFTYLSTLIFTAGLPFAIAGGDTGSRGGTGSEVGNHCPSSKGAHGPNGPGDHSSSRLQPLPPTSGPFRIVFYNAEGGAGEQYFTQPNNDEMYWSILQETSIQSKSEIFEVDYQHRLVYDSPDDTQDPLYAFYYTPLDTTTQLSYIEFRTAEQIDTDYLGPMVYFKWDVDYTARKLTLRKTEGHELVTQVCYRPDVDANYRWVLNIADEVLHEPEFTCNGISLGIEVV